MHPLTIGTEEYTRYDRDDDRRGYRDFAIPAEARSRHIAIIGRTGVGKSDLMRQMIIQDVRNGLGVFVIDPHADLVEDLLGKIDRNVIYVNPADPESHHGINILQPETEDEKKSLQEILVSIFKGIWEKSWGDRLEHILKICVIACLEQPRQATLASVHKNAHR